MTKTDADELYDQSLRASSQYEKLKGRTCGLSMRVCNALVRNGVVDDKSNIDPNKLLDMVENGSIWHLHWVGEKSVREICEWLATQRPAKN